MSLEVFAERPWSSGKDDLVRVKCEWANGMRCELYPDVGEFGRGEVAIGVSTQALLQCGTEDLLF